MAEMIHGTDTIQPRENPNLLEINTAVWLNQVSRKLGRQINLGNVPASEWDRIKELGMDFVWLMGIWKRSQIGRKIFKNQSYFTELIQSALPDWKDADIIGSPFSIVDYRPDRIVGGWEDLARARRELNSRNISLILDFVPNHTAREHDWVTAHPDFYVKGTKKDYERDKAAFLPVETESGTCYLAYGRDPNFPPWSDTLQLNYFNGEVRQAVITEMKKVAVYCDGFRCDMAMLLLNGVFENTWGWLLKKKGCRIPKGEFWSEATGVMPRFMWIAETYWDTESRLLSLGFDYAYDKGLYDRLKSSSTTDIKKYLENDFVLQKKLLRFMENHDELRSAAVFPKAKLQAVAILMATLPGMKLHYEGQFEGKRVRSPVQLRRVIDETYDQGLLTFYKKLFSITNDETFHAGEWKLEAAYPAPQGNHSENLIAYTWRLKTSLKLIVVNLGYTLAQGLIPLGKEVEHNLTYHLVDELDGQQYRRWGGDMAGNGLHVILNAYQAHILSIGHERANLSAKAESDQNLS